MKNWIPLVLLLPIAMLPTGCMLGSHDGEHSKYAPSGYNLNTWGGPVVPGQVQTRVMLMERGEAIYEQVCIHCHQPKGVGFGEVPPLAESDYLMDDRIRPVGILLKGLKDTIVVNGQTYNAEMPALTGSDLSVAAILTYVRNQFNGAADSIGVGEVTAARKALGL